MSATDVTYEVKSSGCWLPIRYDGEEVRDLMLSQDDMLAIAELDVGDEHEVPRLGAPHLFVRRVS